MDSDDFGLGEWSQAIDDFFMANATTGDDAAPEASASPSSAVPEFDLNDCLGQWNDFLNEDEEETAAPGRDGGGAISCASDTAAAVGSECKNRNRSSDQIVTSSRDMYGPIADLASIGNQVQSGIFANFQSAISSGTFHREDKFQDLLESEYVHKKTMKSVAAVESSSGYDRKAISRGLLQYACTLLYGAAFLIGVFFLAWTRVFNAGQHVEPILVIWKRKYDETPLKMKVREHNKFFGTSIPEREVEKAYLHSKILRIESSVSFSDLT